MNLRDLIERSPWTARGLALGAGVAAALAHPPFGLLPGLLGYALLLWLLDAIDGPRPLRSAFLRGWLAGLGYFALGTWWIGEAFLVDAENQGWMAPFAVAAMATGLALFWGAAAVVYRRVRPAGVVRVLAFAAALSAFEWLRGHVLTGFPWNLPGETWRAGSAPSQAAALIGAYGLTWVTLAIAAAPTVWREGRAGRVAAALSLAGLAGLYLGGSLALRAAPGPAEPPVRVRVVQANIAQSLKWDAASFQAIVDAYVSLTAAPSDGEPADVVIWPEGALPAALDDYLAPRTWVRQAITDALKPGQLLLIGGYRMEGTVDRPVYYNSLVALRRETGGLVVVGYYDKHRLVPFGEFLPADGLLTALGVKSMAHLGDGFETGPRPAPLSIAPGLKIQPLICYESLFPGLARTDPGVRALINISNDAWFGFTSGPLQHLNLASYRAIEAGRPMIRATPTGVSAIIDSQGRIVGDHMLPLGRRGVIDGVLPAIGRDTPASRLGDWPLAAFLLVSVAATIANARKTRRKFAGMKDRG